VVESKNLKKNFFILETLLDVHSKHGTMSIRK